jgi:thioredoxin-dependent peroxiredoxin
VVAVTVESLRVSRSLAAQLGVGYSILEDRDHRLGSAFGVFRMPGVMDMGPVDNHSVFVIDAAGRVQWEQLAPETMHVPMDAILAALRSTSR